MNPLDLLPRPPKEWKKLFLMVLAFWLAREATFPLREKDLKGWTACITGGAGGIGAGLARRLAKQGVKVAIWDMDIATAEKTAAEIVAAGGYAKAYKVNVADRNMVYAVGKQTLEDFGGAIDILVNNAGIVAGKKLLEADDARSELTMQVNAIALMWVTKAFLPRMMERKRGHIVTIASSAGRVGVAAMVDYCMSKAGAVFFDESLRSELRHTCPEVKTTCVCPSYINTGMFQNARMRSTIPALDPLVNAIMPVLEPDYVCDKIITAIKRNQTVLVMPKFGYLSHLFRAITPTFILDEAMDVLGVSRSMSKFEQTRPTTLLT